MFYHIFGNYQNEDSVYANNLPIGPTVTYDMGD